MLEEEEKSEKEERQKDREGDTEEDTPLTEEHYVTPINWALSMNYDTVLITIVVWNFQVFQLLTYESFFRSARVIAQELYKAGW